MENHFDKRLNQRYLLMEPSVVSLLLNYYPEQLQNSDTFKISKYAYGADYHFVIKEKLKNFCFLFSPPLGKFQDVLVDSAPVLDKAWAAKEWLRLDWKNSNLLTQKWVLLFYRRTYYRLRFRL
jgi:epoxyqueuosine reductase